ncbi:MAG: rhomboid family intramembrane serine protease [Gammaproteobacteria bacterium]|jgi:membrane associated rhomboid family serine protease|nr:rhomboid family intramembrane serine protease [Gammaproteobacteria bacterium]
MIPLHDDNPTSIFPVFTILFIVICVLVYFWQFSLGAEGNHGAVISLGVIPAVLLNKVSLPTELFVIPAGLTVFTSMFLHGGFMHLAGNMLFLWIFGNNVEDSMGHFRFIIFYLLCGVAAVAGQTLENPDSQIPMIGASGAISGVLGGYLLLYPHARVLVLIPLGFFSQLVRLPAGWVLGLWFGMQIVSSALSNSEGGGVAWFAHIGGFIAGLALIPLFKYKNVKLFQTGHGSNKYSRKLRRR